MKSAMKGIKIRKDDGPIDHANNVYSLIINNNDKEVIACKSPRRSMRARMDLGVQNIIKTKPSPTVLR